MRYQVPQFIEVEDKIFGPLTLKQFIYLAGSAGLAFLQYRLLSGILGGFLGLPIGIAILSFGAALAFYKPDGHRPFIFIVEQAVKYSLGPKLFVWKKQPKKIEKSEEIVNEMKASDVFVPKLSNSKLRELSWSLDIHENIENANDRIVSKADLLRNKPPIFTGGITGKKV